MPDSFYEGNAVIVTMTFEVDGIPTDPTTVLFKIRMPDGTLTTYTRADREGLPYEVVVEPNHRVVFIEAGPHHLPKEALPVVALARVSLPVRVSVGAT